MTQSRREQLIEMFEDAAIKAGKRTARQINDGRSLRSWGNIERALAGHYHRRVKLAADDQVSDDAKSDLLCQFLVRCNANTDACDESRIQWTVTQVVGDVIALQQSAEKAEKYRAESEQTYGLLKQISELVPTHSGMVKRFDGTTGHSRTDRQRRVWEAIVENSQQIADEPATEILGVRVVRDGEW